MERTRQDILEEMGKQGLNKRALVQQSSFYHKCPICGDQISDTNKPVLLQCGHILCISCSEDAGVCGPCNKPFLVKTSPYKLLLDYFRALDNSNPSSKEEVLYHFCIKNMDSCRIQTIQNVPGTITIEALLTKSDDFVSYYQQIKDKTGLVICGKNLIYTSIKSKTIVELSQEKKFRLVPAESKKANEIFFYNYWKGGKGGETY